MLLLRRLPWLLTGAALVLVGYWLGANQPVTPGYTARTVWARDSLPLNAQEQALADLYNAVIPSVVAVNIIDPAQGEVGGGTGFVLDTDGHIATNFHVVDELSARRFIEIEFFDGPITRAQLVTHDPDSDIALLKVDVEPRWLRPVTFGDSASIQVGQGALALGSPFGQDWTLTSGIISALNRDISGLGRYRIGAVIQTDAAINPGNSGGPLLNLRGEVIGVNAQIFSRERANSGVGFAVPSNLVRRVVDELRDKGFVDYAYLGVFALEDVSLLKIEQLRLPSDTRGVVVGSLETSGPAQIGGLRSNDVILAIDNTPVPNFATLIGYLGVSTLPEQRVTVTVLRNGEIIDLSITLGRRRLAAR